MPHNPNRQIPRRMAERQEAVFARLQPFAREVQALARRRSYGAVPENILGAAETLLFEVQAFRPDYAKTGLPAPAPHCGGLAAQLAEALGMLMAYEARHTHWDAVEAETLWVVPGAKMPIRRLLPRPGSKAAARAEAKARQAAELRAARMVDIRAKLVTRLDQFRRREPAPPPANSALLTPHPTSPWRRGRGGTVIAQAASQTPYIPPPPSGGG